jgi:diamine N-acetyltransferase
VKVREEDLLRDGFGDTKYFYFVVAEWRKGDHETDHERPEMAGYGFFFFNYSSADGRVIYLEDLYVKEKYQRNGLGRAMMKKIAEVISLITLTETDSQTTANDVSFPMVFKC